MPGMCVTDAALSSLFAACVPADVVNTGARLAVAAAKQGERVLCSEAVERGTTSAQLQADKLQLEHAGTIKLKGKRGEAKVFRPCPAPADSAATMGGRAATVVGRQQETALLLQALHGLQAGSRGVALVVIEGEAGSGKSAMVCDVLQKQHVTKWLLVRGEASTVAFGMCRSILKWLLEMDDEPEAAAWSWLLVVRMPALLPGLTRPSWRSAFRHAVTCCACGDQRARVQIETSRGGGGMCSGALVFGAPSVLYVCQAEIPGRRGGGGR